MRSNVVTDFERQLKQLDEIYSSAKLQIATDEELLQGINLCTQVLDRIQKNKKFLPSSFPTPPSMKQDIYPKDRMPIEKLESIIKENLINILNGPLLSPMRRQLASLRAAKTKENRESINLAIQKRGKEIEIMLSKYPKEQQSSFAQIRKDIQSVTENATQYIMEHEPTVQKWVFGKIDKSKQHPELAEEKPVKKEAKTGWYFPDKSVIDKSRNNTIFLKIGRKSRSNTSQTDKRNRDSAEANKESRDEADVKVAPKKK